MDLNAKKENRMIVSKDPHLNPQCIGEKFLMSGDAAAVIVAALREYAKAGGCEYEHSISRLASCFNTVAKQEIIEVCRSERKKKPDPKMPEWDYKDEIIERHLRGLRKIAYAIGQIRAILSSINGLNSLPAVKTIEDSVSEALDARRLVIQGILGADCEVPTQGIEKLMETEQKPDKTQP